MFEPGPKARPILRARVPVVRRAAKPLALARAATPKPVFVKGERRRKKNRREKARRRRTRTTSLYGDTGLRNLIALMYL